MANKKIEIEVGVKTDQLDSAAIKLGELKKLSNKISIQYDIDGKPIDVVIDKTLNLGQQVKILTAELRKTKEGTAEFTLLNSKLKDSQDNLTRVNAKSRDLFASFSLIPGPIGEIFGKLNGVIGLLKTFSGFTVKDFGNQFKEFGKDISGIYDAIFGLNKGIEDTTTNLNTNTDAKDENTDATDEGTAATNAGTVANQKQTQVIQGTTESTKEYIQVIKSGKFAITDFIKPISELNEAERKLATEQVRRLRNSEVANKLMFREIELSEKFKNAKNGELIARIDTTGAVYLENSAMDKNTISKEVNTAQTKTAAVANTILAGTIDLVTFATNALNIAFKAIGIGLIIGAIAVLADKLITFVKSFGEASEATKQFREATLKGNQALEEAKNKVTEVGIAFDLAKKGTISKKDALEQYNKILGGTIGQAKTFAEAEELYNNNTANYIKATGLRAEAQQLYAIAAQKSAEAIIAVEKGFFSFERGIGQSRGKANLLDQLLGRKGELEERTDNLLNDAKKLRDRANKAIGEALPLESPFKSKTDGKKDDTAYQKRLSDLDAQIQLEINLTETRFVELTNLYDEKAKMIIDHDKLTYNQSELLRQENDKKVKDAINEDIKRRDAYLAKIDDLETQAISDAQKKEETARIQKLNQDINALNFDEEFLRAGLEEQGKIRLALETKYDQDILDIKDKYFQEKYKREQEAFLKEQELRTKNKENELAVNQQRIDGQNDFNTLYGDFIFGSKGLKAMYEKNFIDLRKVYQDEYDNDVARFTADEELLKSKLESKGITQATYDEQIIQLNEKRTASAEKNTSKQIELDKLEVDSKRASADMTIQVGEKLVGLLGAVAGKNIKLQKAAALLDAGVSIARIITDTSRAIIAFSASVAPLGPAGIPIAAGYAVKAKIGAGLAIATIIAQGIGKLKSLDENSVSGEGGGGQQSSSTTRGMARGGYIDGPRHARGGVMINAEGGEAVMTRGAVSMFGPLLSMMNQAGGGTSFNSNLLTTRQDKPILSNPAQEQAPIVVKTYVVEKDMVTQMNKQARLKDLSTL